MKEADKASREKQKFRRFYLFGSIFWLLSTLLFFAGSSWVVNADINEGTRLFANNVLGIILTFIVFGIPVIFVLSFVIRSIEPVMDRIKQRIDSKD